MSNDFAESIYPDWMLPAAPPPPLPRIGGSAMPGGVHMSTGTLRTSADWQLVMTGLSMAALGSAALVLTYVVTWGIGQVTGWPLVPYLLQIVRIGNPQEGVIFEIGVNLLTMLCFLTLMRISPLSGYHAAEHKVIAAIEHFGAATEESARMMPRAHRRCGSNLLAGILPMMLIGVPLLSINTLLGVGVLIIGWGTRFITGYHIQMIFATKEPSDRQLKAGLAAGEKIMRLWRENPYKRVSPIRNLWNRGFAQMFAGMIVGMNIAEAIYGHLHLWLDF